MRHALEHGQIVEVTDGARSPSTKKRPLMWAFLCQR
jgi:hypothetical protein